MRWRYSYSWIAFIVSGAAIAALVGRSWLQSFMIFGLTAAPIGIWAWSRVRSGSSANL